VATALAQADEGGEGGEETGAAAHRRQRGNALFRAGRVIAAAAEYAEAIVALDASHPPPPLDDSTSSPLDIGAAVLVMQPNTSLRAGMVAYGVHPPSPLKWMRASFCPSCARGAWAVYAHRRISVLGSGCVRIAHTVDEDEGTCDVIYDDDAEEDGVPLSRVTPAPAHPPNDDDDHDNALRGACCANLARCLLRLDLPAAAAAAATRALHAGTSSLLFVRMRE